MIVDATREFAAEQLRPAAAEADTACAAPDTLLKRSVTELGVTQLGVPESLGGMTTERSTITGVLVAEALAHGDMGLAVACLAPAAVSNALVLWGDATQQATYLPAFVGDDVPAAALTLLEPRPLFDPFELRTTARREAGGFVLDGVKSLVPRAASAELFVVAAALEGAPALFLVESGTSGVSVESEPAMGLRAASMGRLVLSDVHVAVVGAARRRRCRRVRRLRAAVASRLGRARVRHRTRGARLRHPLRQRAQGVRRADQPSPGSGVHGRQHRHRARGRAAGHAARGRARRAGPLVRSRGGARPAAHRRVRHADRQQRRAAARRPRLRQGTSGRAVVPRSARDRRHGRRGVAS